MRRVIRVDVRTLNTCSSAPRLDLACATWERGYDGLECCMCSSIAIFIYRRKSPKHVIVAASTFRTLWLEDVVNAD